MRIVRWGHSGDPLTFNVRPDTLDEWVVDEVFAPTCYMRPLAINAFDVVLDIGMHIGAFTVLALEAGAEVSGYEPEPENFQIAQSNVELNGWTMRTPMMHQAGVSDEEGALSLYLNTKKNRGQHSTTPIRGREEIQVLCLGINDVLASRAFTKAKIDCEGEEYKIVMAVKDWGAISRIRMEWHRKLLRDEENVKFDEVTRKLEKDGFRVQAKRDGKGWTQMVTGVRR